MALERYQQFRLNAEKKWTEKWWSHISKNPNLTKKYINEHPKYPWDWSRISSQLNITMELAIYKINEWWEKIYYSPNIKTHPEYDLDWSKIEKDEFIKDLKNKFTKNKELFIIEEARQYMAIYKIKNWWKEIYYSPNTKVGKRRLEKSYDALFE